MGSESDYINIRLMVCSLVCTRIYRQTSRNYRYILAYFFMFHSSSRPAGPGVPCTTINSTSNSGTLSSTEEEEQKSVGATLWCALYSRKCGYEKEKATNRVARGHAGAVLETNSGHAVAIDIVVLTSRSTKSLPRTSNVVFDEIAEASFPDLRGPLRRTLIRMRSF
jgi:hypothetical protein